jgi:hypothetical protein
MKALWNKAVTISFSVLGKLGISSLPSLFGHQPDSPWKANVFQPPHSFKGDTTRFYVLKKKLIMSPLCHDPVAKLWVGTITGWNHAVPMFPLVLTKLFKT